MKQVQTKLLSYCKHCFQIVPGSLWAIALIVASFMTFQVDSVYLFARVNTPTKLLGTVQIESIVSRLIKERLPYNREDVIVEFRRVPHDVAVPDGAVSFAQVSANVSQYRGNIVFQLGIFRDAKLLRSVPISLKIRTFENVVVAARRMGRNQLIEEQDINIERRETTSLPRDILKNEQSVLSKRTKRIIVAGRIIQESMVEYPPAIERGSAVSLVVTIGKVMVTAPAKALEDGYLNDLIEVRNLSSNERISAKVVDSKTVVVATY